MAGLGEHPALGLCVPKKLKPNVGVGCWVLHSHFWTFITLKEEHWMAKAKYQQENRLAGGSRKSPNCSLRMVTK
jgi:hypothetical protein